MCLCLFLYILKYEYEHFQAVKLMSTSDSRFIPGNWRNQFNIYHFDTLHCPNRSYIYHWLYVDFFDQSEGSSTRKQEARRLDQPLTSPKQASVFSCTRKVNICNKLFIVAWDQDMLEIEIISTSSCRFGKLIESTYLNICKLIVFSCFCR